MTSLLGLFVLGNTITVHAQDVVSVDPSSGNAIVNIPLHTVKYGAIATPINLIRQSSAMAVEQGEGDAGMGWNLTCNYAVYRQVRGLPDEVNVSTGATKSGWLTGTTGSSIQSFTPTSNDDLTQYQWSDETADYNFLNGYIGTKDTEPDLYTVIGPNLYASFVYDGSGGIRLLEYQDIQITPISNGFTVTNNLGHVYQFTVKESVTRKAKSYKDAVVDMFTTEYEYFKDDGVPQFTSAWYLSSLADEKGLVTNFNYIARSATKSTQFKSRITQSNLIDTLYTITDEFSPQRLSSITAGNTTAEFFWTSRLLLSDLKIRESGLSDSYQYGLKYANAIASFGTGPSATHYFLITIDVYSSATCATEVPYRFSYKGVGNSIANSSFQVDFPWQRLHAQDMWGFYNGVIKTDTAAYLNDVPRLYYYTGQTDSRRFTIHAIPGQTVTKNLWGAKRFTEATKIDIGTLTRISYPTGGYTKIEYERNKYLDSLAGQVLHGPGLRVKSITTSGGDAAYNRTATIGSSYHDIIKTYYYSKSEADTTSSGVIFYPPSYGFNSGARLIRTIENQGPSSQIAYRRVKESTAGYGYKVYIYSYPARYPFTTNSADWTATKSKIARSGYFNLSDVKNGYYTFPFAPNPNYAFSQGLLTSVTEFSESNVIKREKKITYTKINPSLYSVYGVSFEKLTECSCIHFSKYEIITGTKNVITKEVVRIGDDQAVPVYSTNTKNYYYNNTSGNYLLNSVEDVRGDGSVSRQYIKYVKDFSAITSPTVGDVMANAIKLMNSARRHAEVVETYTVFTPAGGSANTVGGSLKTYKDFGSSKVYPWQNYSLPDGATLTPAFVVTGATQGFSKDSDYFLQTSADDYDAQGNPASVSDDDKNIAGLHSAQNYSLPPVATFKNATAKQTVYEGFEFPTGRSLTATNALSYTAGWTGERAATLTSSNSLYHNSVDNIGKPYRVSCYVKAAQNSTITFSFVNPAGGTLILSVNATYAPSTLNTWVYLEQILNITSNAVPQVKLTVTSNATVTIDDVMVMPATAIVSSKTFLPFKGQTSDTDDRGYSSTVTYDGIGRKVAVSDRQRNLVELNEYIAKGATTRFITSGFTVGDLYSGTSFTATASPYNCFGTPSYQWKIDGVAVGTNSSTLTSSIATAGAHTISLTVSNPSNGGTSTTTQDVCVLLSGATFNLTTDATNGEVCNVQGSPAHFAVTSRVYCGGLPATMSVTWYVSINGGAFTYAATGPTFSKSGYHPMNTTTSVRVKAVVRQTCPGGQGVRCNDATIPVTSDEIYLNVIDCTN